MAAYRYEQQIYHEGLNKSKIIKGDSRKEVESKVAFCAAQWDKEWKEKQAKQKKALSKEKKAKSIEKAIEKAEKRTSDAENIQYSLDSILLDALNNPINLKELKTPEPFPIEAPASPVYNEIPPEPKRDDEKYNPSPSLFVMISKRKLAEFNATNEKAFLDDHAHWEEMNNSLKATNENIHNKYENDLSNWKQEKEKHDTSEQNRINNILSGEKEAVEECISYLLTKIKYPFEFTLSGTSEYITSTKSLILDVFLPNLEAIPTLKNVKYIKSREEFKETYYSEAYLNKKYDSIIYQIVLQITMYLFDLLDSNILTAITINGKIHTIDKSTGQQIEPYLLSININRSDFVQLNLESIDPKTWFKSAKGVSASSIAKITPIAPIIKISKIDNRFIEGYDVIDAVDSSINLASMDWQDFENLIREIFEQEFNTTGGEVKITQASRDGGVDAIAFDPDPIRGGKIVIQAKRYTNTVGVSAVRDLYGTVMNEGANKGILVTTSNFGNDAYSFADGKPITLMNGSNLLFLLDKHGHKAHIDLKEAKKELSNQ